MRLQIEAKLGRRIMEYVWPDRRNRKPEQSQPDYKSAAEEGEGNSAQEIYITVSDHGHGNRSSLDSPRSLQRLHIPSNSSQTVRHLGTSRSFTDLRHANVRDENRIRLPKSVSTDSLNSSSGVARKKTTADIGTSMLSGSTTNLALKDQPKDDATEMKYRSAQRSFVLVRVAR